MNSTSDSVIESSTGKASSKATHKNLHTDIDPALRLCGHADADWGFGKIDRKKMRGSGDEIQQAIVAIRSEYPKIDVYPGET